MSANLKDPFGPSCCEAGGYSPENSAQWCGCDKGSNHLCERHYKENQARMMTNMYPHVGDEGETATLPARPSITLLEVKLQDGCLRILTSGENLIGTYNTKQQASSLMQQLTNLGYVGAITGWAEGLGS